MEEFFRTWLSGNEGFHLVRFEKVVPAVDGLGSNTDLRGGAEGFAAIPNEDVRRIGEVGVDVPRPLLYSIGVRSLMMEEPS